MNKDLMKEIIENIKESADELKSQEKLNEVEYGQLLGYAETLSIIKDACAGYDLNELGIDFDIDKNTYRKHFAADAGCFFNAKIRTG